MDHCDLLHQKRFARLDFIRFRIAVVWRAALDHVGDVNVAARQSCRLQEIVQELSCSPDKRLPLLVFVEPRRFPHEHHACVRIPYTKHYLGSAHLCQLATLAVMQRFAELEEGHDDAGELVKALRDFRRGGFPCQWSRNGGIWSPSYWFIGGNGFGATVPTDNGAFEVGRPSCIGPTTS